jgi:hypothetical protein
MSADEPSATGLTPSDLLVEMREDIQALRSLVDSVPATTAL